MAGLTFSFGFSLCGAWLVLLPAWRAAISVNLPLSLGRLTLVETSILFLVPSRLTWHSTASQLILKCALHLPFQIFASTPSALPPTPALASPFSFARPLKPKIPSSISDLCGGISSSLSTE